MRCSRRRSDAMRRMAPLLALAAVAMLFAPVGARAQCRIREGTLYEDLDRARCRKKEPRKSKGGVPGLPNLTDLFKGPRGSKAPATAEPAQPVRTAEEVRRRADAEKLAEDTRLEIAPEKAASQFEKAQQDLLRA